MEQKHFIKLHQQVPGMLERMVIVPPLNIEQNGHAT